MKKGFTLIEIIVAITILSVIMVSVFQIYTRVVLMNKRLEISRELQENARLISETIGTDIRQNGIDFSFYVPPNNAHYTESGSDILATNAGKYYLMQDTDVHIGYQCDQTQIEKCYLGKELPNGTKIRLSSDSVVLRNVRFFISGVGVKTFSNPSDTEWKATIVYTLAVWHRAGIDYDAVKNLIIPVQTTFTEKLYKAH